MTDANRKTNTQLTRRDLLKLAGGALGLGALGYTAGLLNQPAPAAPAGEALPGYIDDGAGMPVFRGPFLQQARMAAFLFPADQAQITRLCDRHLNLSPEAPYRYTPLLSNLVMIFSDMLVSSLDERDSQTGLIPETELSFWIPLLVSRKTGSGVVPDHLAWFLPALFVDDGSAIATGREVYGFNKQQAQFRKPDDTRDPLFAASVMSLREFGPSARAEMQPLFELKRSPSSAPMPVETWSDWPTAQTALNSRLAAQIQPDPGSSFVDFAAHLVTDKPPLVFLKQFRDAADTRRACYQALVEAPLKIQKFGAGGFLPRGYELHIQPLASHPIAATLGLNSAQPASLGIWLNLDFSLEAGREVWKRA